MQLNFVMDEGLFIMSFLRLVGNFRYFTIESNLGWFTGRKSNLFIASLNFSIGTLRKVLWLKLKMSLSK
jgi:hypothetical protein